MPINILHAAVYTMAFTFDSDKIERKTSLTLVIFSTLLVQHNLWCTFCLRILGLLNTSSKPKQSA